MKITVGYIITFLFIILGYYTSIDWFILPFIKDTIDEESVLTNFGAFITFIMAIFSILVIIHIIARNWNKGFKINLKFNKNKE